MMILPRRLLVLGGAVAVAAGSFAYMSSGSGSPSYASTDAVTVNSYAVYNVTYTPANNGDIGYIHFSSIPEDNDNSVTSWPAYGAVEVGSTWYSCTFAWGGNDTRTSSYTDRYDSTTSTVIPGSPTSTPQASWTCDIRDTNGNGVPASAWAGVNSLQFLVMA